MIEADFIKQNRVQLKEMFTTRKSRALERAMENPEFLGLAKLYQELLVDIENICGNKERSDNFI